MKEPWSTGLRACERVGVWLSNHQVFEISDWRTYWIGLVSCWEKNCGSGGAFVSLWINWRNVRSTVLHQRNGGELITLKFI